MNIRRITALLLVMAFLLAGCGSSYASQKNTAVETYAAAAPADMAMAEEFSVEMAAGSTTNSVPESGTSLPENRKFIINMNISAETEDLETVLSQLNQKINSLSGYIEDQSIRNGSAYSTKRYRSANLIVRIPVDQLDSFTDTLGGLVNVVSSSRSTTDVTLQYVDTESRITALKTEQTRLLELLAKAENMADLLDIEARLTDVRYELEQYSSQLRLLDNRIDYATVSLSLSEVKEYTPVEEKSRLETIKDGFVTSLKDLGEGILDFFSAVLIDLPYLVLYGLILWGVVAFIRKVNRKRKAKKQAMANAKKTDTDATEKTE